MTPAWRLIGDDGVGAAEGLAGDEALMQSFGRGEAAEHAAALRLYTYRSHCALVGRYQDLDAEVDRAACTARGIDVGRRPTGGGAILMGADQLGVAVATRAPAGRAPRDLLAEYARGVIAGLETIGVRASFRGKNDLEVDGRKIAGLGLYVDDRGALLFHASVLAGLDVEQMLAVLRIPGAKLADKGVARVHERLTTVGRETGRPWSGAELRDAIAAGFRAAVGCELEPSALDDRERERRDELAATRYGNERWLAGEAARVATRGTAVLKTPEGLVRIYAGVQRGALSSVLVTGDFTAPPPALLDLEAALRWCRADRERIAELTAWTLGTGVLGVSADVLAAAVWEAAERALERGAGAAPVRASGSCYYPEPGAARSEEVVAV